MMLYTNKKKDNMIKYYDIKCINKEWNYIYI